MNIGDFLKNNANDLLGIISQQAGGPQLPPLQFVDPYQNNNAYVEARPAPASYQPETTPAPERQWLMYGAAGIAAIVVIAMLMRK
ncbi:MAG: hypothetical protein AB7T49_21590 [Oligoflexales bacterium]